MPPTVDAVPATGLAEAAGALAREEVQTEMMTIDSRALDVPAHLPAVIGARFQGRAPSVVGLRNQAGLGAPSIPRGTPMI